MRVLASKVRMIGVVIWIGVWVLGWEEVVVRRGGRKGWAEPSWIGVSGESRVMMASVMPMAERAERTCSVVWTMGWVERSAVTGWRSWGVTADGLRAMTVWRVAGRVLWMLAGMRGLPGRSVRWNWMPVLGGAGWMVSVVCLARKREWPVTVWGWVRVRWMSLLWGGEMSFWSGGILR